MLKMRVLKHIVNGREILCDKSAGRLSYGSYIVFFSYLIPESREVEKADFYIFKMNFFQNLGYGRDINLASESELT